MTSTGSEPDGATEVRTYYGRPVVKRPVWKWY
ncbi:MAG: hypothetical protein QOD63_886, partial [Actinomycetota bacterium]|nr:hypothetical protein [Actinomycetota bacterium]